MNPVQRYVNDNLPGIALGLWMAGVAVAHGMRFVLFADPPGRQLVALGGVLVYSLSSALAFVPDDHAQGTSMLLCVLFPFVGVTAVALSGAELDAWQLGVGITQVAAMLYALVRAIWETR
jgi:hypothetical protein